MTRTGTKDPEAAGTLRGAASWLAAEELRRSRLSLLATALATVILALLASALVLGFYAERAAYASFALDVYLLAACCNLALNWTAVGYWTPTEDRISRRLAFLRSLPIPTRALVAGRALVMVLTLAVMASVFFLALYRLSGDLRADLGPAGYLGFAGIWSGYALLMGAFGLYLEWGFSGKTLFRAQFVWVGALLAAAATANLLGVRLFAGSVELARAFGPLAGFVALLVGAAGLALSTLATARRLRRREL